MMNFGETIASIKDSNCKTKVKNISLEQIPDLEKLVKLQGDLLKLDPEFISVGHGSCLKL